jgi:Fur family peroxide stress response transcriptional regulator
MHSTSPASARFETLVSALREQRYRLTPQRLELVRLIAASQEHPNAFHLFAMVKTRFPTMSQATVYKTLALLKEIGQVLEIDLHGDSHYDGNRPDPHPHLVCTRCDRIVDGDLDLKPSELARLERASGYHDLRPQITLFGVCPRCSGRGK